MKTLTCMIVDDELGGEDAGGLRKPYALSEAGGFLQ